VHHEYIASLYKRNSKVPHDQYVAKHEMVAAVDKLGGTNHAKNAVTSAEMMTVWKGLSSIHFGVARIASLALKASIADLVIMCRDNNMSTNQLKQFVNLGLRKAGKVSARATCLSAPSSAACSNAARLISLTRTTRTASLPHHCIPCTHAVMHVPSPTALLLTRCKSRRLQPPCMHAVQEPILWENPKYNGANAYKLLDLYPKHTLYDGPRFPTATVHTTGKGPSAERAAGYYSLDDHARNLPKPSAHANRVASMATGNRNNHRERKAAAAAAAAAASLEDSDVEVQAQHSCSGSSDDDKPLSFRASTKQQRGRSHQRSRGGRGAARDRSASRSRSPPAAASNRGRMRRGQAAARTPSPGCSRSPQPNRRHGARSVRSWSSSPSTSPVRRSPSPATRSRSPSQVLVTSGSEEKLDLGTEVTGATPAATTTTAATGTTISGGRKRRATGRRNAGPATRSRQTK
jgi:hypothetical protein